MTTSSVTHQSIMKSGDFTPAAMLLQELQAIPDHSQPSSPLINLLMSDLWLEYMSGNINAVCNGPSKQHRCILCCPLCRRGSRCCYECHRCKYNPCSKHRTSGCLYAMPEQRFRVYDPYFYTLFGSCLE